MVEEKNNWLEGTGEIPSCIVELIVFCSSKVLLESKQAAGTNEYAPLGVNNNSLAPSYWFPTTRMKCVVMGTCFCVNPELATISYTEAG